MHSTDKSSYFNTDKIEPHGYFQAYVKLAAELGPRARVCELGVEEGESLRIWQSLFPLGEITGVDANNDAIWPDGTVKVVARQDDPALPGMLRGRYDLIVDDCSHDGTLTQMSWMLLWPQVSPGGYYVIEDWMVALRSDPQWGGCWGPSMLKVAESFLTMLHHRNSDVDQVTYRYGLIIIRKREKVDILTHFRERCSAGSDISLHLPFLFEEAKRKTVIELGVRSGNSTSAFLAAAKEVWSVDINVPRVPEEWLDLRYWNFLQSDDLSDECAAWLPAETDVLFIDSDHTYEHALAELEKYGPRVRPGGVILLHDTQYEKQGGLDIDTGRPTGPVAKAATAYCKRKNLTWENRPGSYGLGVIRIPRSGE